MVGFQFLGELLLEFVKGILNIFVSTQTEVGGLFGGLFRIINVMNYIDILNSYKASFGVGDWFIAILGMLILLVLIAGLFFLLYRLGSRLIRRYFSKKPLNDDLLDEIARLNAELTRVHRSRERLLDLQSRTGGAISQHAASEMAGDPEYSESVIGAPSMAGESAVVSPAVGGATVGGVAPAMMGTAMVAATAMPAGNIVVNANPQSSISNPSGNRYYKLMEIDELYQSDNPPEFDFNNDVSLEEICDNIRHWCCKERRLFYEPRVIRLFVSALATTRLIILQGISGTGKTSLPYALGVFLDNPATIAPVQPSWRDRTEIFGYFNEFTKRYNETEILRAMYESLWNDNVYLTVIDEANISRIEYYFAELLSIYELPSRDNWCVDLTSSGWDTDPHFINKGRMRLPHNMWYIATINNDDSTFSVSDKVYDRAIPININSKGIPFEPDAEKSKHYRLSYKRLEEMFKDAQEKYRVSQENIDKFNKMDDYVIEHFRLAFGNRIVKQLNEFVPVYVACGGTEIDGLDYVLCNKILRKFESLNLNYIRDEVDGYIEYLNTHFGEENMTESKEYLLRLKKLF